MTHKKDFWIPQYRYQLVEWLAKYFYEPPKNFKEWSKAKCYAVYFRIHRNPSCVPTKGVAEIVGDNEERFHQDDQGQ